MFFKLVGTSSSGVRTLFDGNCWKCLVNNLSNQANYLHAAAKKALEACVELAKYARTSTQFAMNCLYHSFFFQSQCALSFVVTRCSDAGAQLVHEILTFLLHVSHAYIGTP